VLVPALLAGQFIEADVEEKAGGRYLWRIVSDDSSAAELIRFPV